MMKLLRDGELRARILAILQDVPNGGPNMEQAVDAVFRVYRATVYAAVEGNQRKDSAGWRETRARAQAAALRAVKKAVQSR